MNSQSEGAGIWEGLGGPVRMDRPDMNGIDPTLEACCRREEESIRSGNALMRTLRRFDVVAERERRRRNLVQTTQFAGCRCCYDPNSDGGEYRALMELRETQQQEVLKDVHEEDVEEEKKNESSNEETDSEEDDEFDYLLDEDLPGQDEELKALEDMRRAELELSLLHREIALQHGYGVHRQMHPNRVLKAAGLVPGTRDPPPAVVLHLFDPDSMASAALDLYLETLASQSARGTKFLRSGGRSTLLMGAALAEKVLPRLQPDRDIPALIAIKDGVVVNVCPRLQGLTDRDSDTIVTDAVYEWLDRSGVLLEQPPRMEEVCRIRPEEEALMDYLMTQPKQPVEEGERFDCGVADCNKCFPHEHIGVQNEQQEGRVVSEKDVLGREES